MIVVNHGEWVPYVPSVPHPNAPPNTLYALRNEDKVDWYNFMPNNFQAGTVKMTLGFRQDNWIVSSAVFEGNMLFPAGQMILEIMDYVGTNPAWDFNNKIYDPATHTFSPLPITPV